MAEFAYESDTVGAKNPAASPHSAGEVHVNTGRVAVDVALATDDIVGLCVLPAGCIPTDFVLKLEAIADAAQELSVGLANADKTDITNVLITDSVVGIGGGIVHVDATDLDLQAMRALTTDRYIALKVVTEATNAIAGEIMGELYYRAVEQDEWT